METRVVSKRWSRLGLNRAAAEQQEAITVLKDEESSTFGPFETSKAFMTGSQGEMAQEKHDYMMLIAV